MVRTAVHGATMYVRICYTVMQAVLSLAKPMGHPTMATIRGLDTLESIQVTPIIDCS